MTEYCVAGRSDCVEFAKCEYIVNYLHKNLPVFSCNVVRVHPPHWMSFIEDLAKTYHFTRVQKTSPVVYTTQGKLIGGAEELYTIVLERYGMKVETLLAGTDWSLVAAENQQECDERLAEDGEVQSYSLLVDKTPATLIL
eukprot:JZ551330.1.p1 GENE.JZ551330.1~~JZ551330.1.p1  ORF type:complete len:140 (+),score=4.30 JZ551330.1:85-504(+)